MNLQERLPLGSEFFHCGRKCVVMRYIDQGEAMHSAGPIGMRYEYADNRGMIRWGSIAECEYPAVLAQNPLPSQLEVY
jgi:hypothetical protein